MGDQDAATDVVALRLKIEMRLRHKERIRSSVVSAMTRWRSDGTDLNYGTRDLLGESICPNGKNTNHSRRVGPLKVTGAPLTDQIF
jgi:hypothetical protein